MLLHPLRLIYSVLITRSGSMVSTCVWRCFLDSEVFSVEDYAHGQDGNTEQGYYCRVQ